MSVPDELQALGLPRPGGFLEATSPYREARFVIVGVPMDHTTSFRPGARDGPRRIRELSEGLESYSPRWKVALEACAVADLGDLTLPWGDVESGLGAVERLTRRVVRDGRCPVLLGGEHLLTLGAVRALADEAAGLWVVQLDAHLDLRDRYLGQRLSHATVMRRVAEIVGLERVVALGVRSGTKEEWDLARRTHRPAEGSLVSQAAEVARALRGRPFYLTVDIDVADPAYAPGTGTPEPGGPTAAEVLEAVGLLAAAGPVGVDVVEVCPPRDPADLAAVLAAKVVREAVAAKSASGHGAVGV